MLGHRLSMTIVAWHTVPAVYLDDQSLHYVWPPRCKSRLDRPLTRWDVCPSCFGVPHDVQGFGHAAVASDAPHLRFSACQGQVGRRGWAANSRHRRPRTHCRLSAPDRSQQQQQQQHLGSLLATDSSHRQCRSSSTMPCPLVILGQVGCSVGVLIGTQQHQQHPDEHMLC
jgi:hypothetical protein